ncbi:peptidase [Devosia pacifica]|uniref:Peptidase n=1 Tax=Devosia pacifica TaxID=1335967 RepID=A0A918RVC0_9HYPH|nr:imelysin family protein [Devosia pacifica]GHA12287.1 peptidase [Devosia pacifica]
MARTFATAMAGAAIAVIATQGAAAVEAADVVETYADIAQATYEDSLETAQTLQEAVETLISEPTEANLEAAKQAWLAARVPYQQTEAYRFGNAIVDDWEGKVNAWPLDEGLIDYVDSSYGGESDVNAFYTVNVIANDRVSSGGVDIDVSEINPDVLAQLHEVGGVEANVATGYHAIEFLLWGQDLNGTNAGSGTRPVTDFDTENCTGGNCERRADYLSAAADLLVSDLEEMVGNWQDNGAARTELTADPGAGIAAMLTGLGSLSYGELAGERMKLGLLLNDPEEEHDCFSDNTHNSHYYDVMGIRNVWTGTYEGVDGDTVEGPSLADYVAETDEALASEMDQKLGATVAAFEDLKARGDDTEAYDQMIGEGNTEGNAVVQAAIDGLVDHTRTLERIIDALNIEGIEIEGSDSLDSPNAVFG